MNDEAARGAGASGRARDATERFERPPTPDLARTLPSAPREGERPAPGSLSFDERYTLIEELARGGMGRVLVGSDRVLRREVAIKEMLTADDPESVARFERESLMTAGLQHPSIIPVYEVGRRPSGEPFIVMRRVHGKPLGELFWERKALADRLRLLPNVLAAIDALAYAHERAIVHRDLKPQNILVGRFGETVVIDWGLAKERDVNAPLAVDPAAPGPRGGATSAPELTQAGTVVGTPCYMAPEQAMGLPADERTDVYALGAVLYELLSGEMPYTAGSAREVLQQVVDQPPRPLEALVPGLPPDLVTIVDKAMSRDPRDRFATAQEMAEQLRSFLSGQLVSAHRYSFGQLAARWARKHRMTLAVAGLALILLAGLAAFSVRRIVAERDRANREKDAAARVADFVIGMFRVADPNASRGDSITAREVLDAASAQIDDGLDKDPSVKGQLMGVMASVYADLGLLPRAEALLRKALAAQRRANDPLALGTLTDLGTILYQEGLYAKAEPLLREAYETRRATLGADARETLGAMGNLASLYDDTGRYAEAEKLMQEAVVLRTKAYGADDRDTLLARSNLVSVIVHQGRFDEAIGLARQSVADLTRVLGADHPDTLQAVDELSQLLRQQGALAEAEQLERANLATEQHVLGRAHPSTVSTMGALASIYDGEEKFSDAEALLNEALPLAVNVEGADHPDTLELQASLAGALAGEGRLEEAEPMLRALVERRARVLGPEHPKTLESRFRLAELLRREGRFAQAKELDEAVLEAQRRVLNADHRDAALTEWSLGLVAAQQGERAKALEALAHAARHGLTARDLERLSRDPALGSLAKEPAFLALSQAARE